MIIGVPKEIKEDEARVALVPSGVGAFVAHGHTVLVEQGAGLGSGIPDSAYRKAGARMVQKAASVWERAELIVKVKEPLGNELRLMRSGQIIYTYLHLASNEKLTKALMRRGVTAIAYETIQLDSGALPLLVPMSEVAGRLAVQKGAQCLESILGGRGILLSGVSGVKPADVVILGAGVAGSNACRVAVGMNAHVSVMDINPQKLAYLYDVMGGKVTTIMSNPANVEEEVSNADLVIGTVLVPGARTPRLVSRKMVRQMRKGSVLLDIAIDQGGCAETSRPTTHGDPVYMVNDVVHYCVANMPGAVPRTSTYALTNVTLEYGLLLADKGFDQAVEMNEPLRKGVNVHDGKIRYEAVAKALQLPFSAL
ncbi:MAG: alanine dehydrogenase [Candidatus Hydrogenedentota bacterium]|nr:MAG: alanine dehydrogenase [Candidatus Hydrogenedentota bacterium]